MFLPFLRKRQSLSLIAAMLCALPAGAEVKTWKTTAGTNDWSVGTNWYGDAAPSAGDEVYITNANVGVLLSSSAPSSGWLSSLMVSNTATLMFTNWATTIKATNVTIQKSAVVTCAGPFTNEPDMSNRVWIVCSNLMVAANGAINADAKGYAGGSNAPGYGPGGGPTNGSAGGYGGRGGNNTTLEGGPTYGSPEAPLLPGSGGSGLGSATRRGGAGGGAIRIEAAGHVCVNGNITANGTYGDSASGSGAGGAVFITCTTFGGTNGRVQVQGGDHASYSQTRTSAGGGRMAIDFNTNAQRSLPPHSVFFSANRGPTQPNANWPLADIGTIWLAGPELLNLDGLNLMGKLCLKDAVLWAPDRLTVTNGWVRFYPDGFELALTNDLLVTGSSTRFDMGGSDVVVTNGYIYYPCSSTLPVLRVGGNLVVSNGAAIRIFSAAAADPVATTNLGALVSVTGDLVIYSNSWIYAYSHAFNGGSPRFKVRNLLVPGANGGIDAVGLGWRGGSILNDAYGTGRGAFNNKGGGGYGGAGGCADATGGQPYGSLTEPCDPGSGGSGNYQLAYWGGAGGGLIRIFADEDVLLNGLLRADGGDANAFAGGGSGGGVYLACKTLSGTGGRISANGGCCPRTIYLSTDGAGSGGGRIAVSYTPAMQMWTPGIIFSAAPGDGRKGIGDPGTLWFPDNRFLNEVMPHSGQWSVNGFTNWSVSSLCISNAWFRFSAAGFRLTVTNALTILGTNDGSCRVELTNGVVTCGSDLTVASSRLTLFSGGTTGSTLACGGNLILTNVVGGTNPSSFYVYGAMTNSGTPDYGTLVAVGGTLYVGSNCWVYPISHPTNGGSPLFRMKNLTLDATNSGIDARGSGFMGGIADTDTARGPGRGLYLHGGGGYGGRGGKADATRGITYGSSNAPVDAGSGGSCGRVNGAPGGNGGGVVRIQAPEGTMTLNGQILADGNNSGTFSGGGSGGSIYLICRKFVGLSGVLSANGGAGYTDAPNTTLWGGGGGGGRIAVWRVRGDAGACSITATGASGGAGSGETGTIVWNWIAEQGTIFVVR